MKDIIDNSKNLISYVTLNSKGRASQLSVDLSRELEETSELLKNANDAFNSKYTLAFYDEFLLTYIRALELKIDAIVTHAKSLSEIKPIEGSVAEVFSKYNERKRISDNELSEEDSKDDE